MSKKPTILVRSRFLDKPLLISICEQATIETASYQIGKIYKTPNGERWQVTDIFDYYNAPARAAPPPKATGIFEGVKGSNEHG